ncbi:MAG: polyprenyl synthetase family protein [Chloroflexi bacterium]|nr:polyprenyl synthetase family protein [Chloroflexota bacterium]
MQSVSFYEPVMDRLVNVNSSLTEMAERKHPFLAQLLDHTFSTPGKYIRPAITLLASNFYAHDERITEKMATGVELLHIASLIHDDTVDGAALRRGKLTISSLWGPKAAVLAGDYIFAASATLVCDTGNIRVIRRFAETIMELSSGELQEMAETYNPEQSMESYLERIYNKTASLFTTAAESGAILSGAPDACSEALRSYGHNLGMAFQVVDDILDFDGTEEETGKPIGSDLANGVVTLPTLIAMKQKNCCDAVTRALKHPEDSELMQEAVSIIQDDTVLEESYEFAGRYCVKALSDLKGLPPSPSRDSLEELVSHVKVRRS